MGGPKGRERARRWGAQNFTLFFLSPTGNFILSSLSGESSRGEERMKFPVGERKKRAKILGGPGEGRFGRRRGGSGERVVRGRGRSGGEAQKS